MKNGGNVDLDDDYQATWVYEQNGPGSVAIDLFRKSDKIYNRFEVSNCQLASIGGTQCAPADGGCVSCGLGEVRSLLMGAFRT